MWKYRSEPGRLPAVVRGLAEFALGAALLALALFLALSSSSAVRRGEFRLAAILSLAALTLAVVVVVTVVPRLVRRIDFGRWRLPFSFSITREGAVYILAVFLLCLVAINTGNNLLFLILSALLSAILVSGIAARLSLRSVLVSLRVPENVFQGEPVAIQISLWNRKRFLPAFSVFVEDVSMGGARSLASRLWNLLPRRGRLPVSGRPPDPVLSHPGYFPVVFPGDVRSELVSQSFERRGLYQLNGFRISTRFPFGFFRRGERVDARGDILVYPAIREISAYFHLLPFRPGQLEGSQRGSGESLYAIRKYQEGESARIVDWKATAKTGEMMARDFAREEENRFSLILDTVVSPGYAGDVAEQFEKAVSLAASLAVHFIEEGAELELLSPPAHVQRGIGRDHLYRLLKSLAVIEPTAPKRGKHSDLRGDLKGILDADSLEEILSEKVYKIIITSKPRGSFPATIWRSSHVIYFDEI